MAARCPVCYRPLKLWPVGRGPPEFTCCSRRLCRPLVSLSSHHRGERAESKPRSKTPCRNDGTDQRFNCYNCDIDYCGDCAKAEQFAADQVDNKPVNRKPDNQPSHVHSIFTVDHELSFDAAETFALKDFKKGKVESLEITDGSF